MEVEELDLCLAANIYANKSESLMQGDQLELSYVAYP